jgi:hypothetical protein
LLSLDPFYAANWQGAPLTGSRWGFIKVCQFGTSIQITPSGLPSGPTHLVFSIQDIITEESTYKQSVSETYSTTIESKFTYAGQQSNGITFGETVKEQLGSGSDKGSVGGSVTGTISGSATQTSITTNTQTMTVNYQGGFGIDYKTAITYSGTLDDVEPSTQTKGAAAGATVLPVASTDYFSVNDAIIINVNGSTAEAAIIASIQVGTSFTLSKPLANTHGAGEIVIPLWNEMNVDAYRDLQFGGIAFQDTNAKLGFFILPPRQF